MFHILIRLSGLDTQTKTSLLQVLKTRPDFLVLPDDSSVIPDVTITDADGQGQIRLSDTISLPMRLDIFLTQIETVGMLPQKITDREVVLEPYLGHLNLNNLSIKLTDIESGLLARLILAKGQHVPRSTLLAGVWGFADGIETHTLDTHMYRLRQKIEPDPNQPIYVLTGQDSYYMAQDTR